MRVLEGKATNSALAMTKKKHKLRKQSRGNEICAGSDSSDDGGANGSGCPHLGKAINFAASKKALKQIGVIGECTSCLRDSLKGRTHQDDPSSPVSALAEQDAMSPEGANDQAQESEPPTIWVCLQCGHQGCDRNSKEKHALHHYQTPRSASHAVVINIVTWVIWCYDCDDDVILDGNRKLQECVDFLRKLTGAGVRQTPAPASTLKRLGSRGEADVGGEGVSPMVTDNNNETLATRAKPRTALPAPSHISMALPKVKGLNNLGNTCFFNAVLQNIGQTYALESVLKEKAAKGTPVTLYGRASSSDNDSDDASPRDQPKKHVTDCKKAEPRHLDVFLGEAGCLTQAVQNFYLDMHSASRSSTISPSSLFGHVCKKAPRFKGFQQQDSHELLRHLLDGMKGEEVKRSQAGILKALNLCENVTAKKVDEETKARLKEYGRQVKHTFVDSVFGGLFLSTVLCEECKTPSQIFEPFLDISLPIMEEKTVRPNSTWGGRKKDFGAGLANHLDPVAVSGGSADATSDLHPSTSTSLPSAKGGGSSKHQSKKIKQQLRRDSKKKGKKSDSSQDKNGETGAGKGGEAAPTMADTQTVPPTDVAMATTGAADSGTPPNANSQSQSDCDMSDADVEDNIESDVSRSRLHLANGAGVRGGEGREAHCPEWQQPGIPGDGESGASLSTASSITSIEKSDSAGATEESTLTETSATEEKPIPAGGGVSAPSGGGGGGGGSHSDSTCKASSAEESDHDRRAHAASVSASAVGADAEGAVADRLAKRLEGLHLPDGGCGGGATNGEEPSPPTPNNASPHPRVHSSSSSTSLPAKTNNAHQASRKHGRLTPQTSTDSYSPEGGDPSGWRAAALEAKLRAVLTLAPRYQPVSQECSIQSCLHQFTAAELLTGNNKFGCEICTRHRQQTAGKPDKKETLYTNASKQVLLFQPPAVLTLHLKRFQQVGFSLRKVNRHVEFPMVLDIAPYCSALCQGIKRDDRRVLYSLYGVVEHSGRLTGGHYTAYVKVRPKPNRDRDYFLQRQDLTTASVDKVLVALNQLNGGKNSGLVGPSPLGGPPASPPAAHYPPAATATHIYSNGGSDPADGSTVDPEESPLSPEPPSGKWYYISDSRVSEVKNESNVLRCQAYILFYERFC